MNERLKTIGKVLITMAIILFMGAPLLRTESGRVAISSVDRGLWPAYKVVLFHFYPSAPDGATFLYTCALTLGAAGVVALLTGCLLCWQRGQDGSGGAPRP